MTSRCLAWTVARTQGAPLFVSPAAAEAPFVFGGLEPDAGLDRCTDLRRILDGSCSEQPASHGGYDYGIL